MRASRQVILLFLTGFLFSSGLFSADLSFRVYGALGCVNGGDFNRSISGWRSYYQDRQGDGFSSSFDLGEMHGTAELGVEAVLALSRRFSLSLGVGYIHQKTSGEITTQTTRHEDITISASERWTVDFEETTEQNPAYTKSTIPITLSLDYSLALNARWTLTLGGGGGIYLGNLDLLESYAIDSESISEQQTGDGVVQYVDRLSTVGDYSEKTKSTGFGLHGRIGLDLKLSPSSCLSIAILGRWVNMKNWEGTRHDASEWQWTYGFWGDHQVEGSDERTEDGQYWTYDLKDEESGKSYAIIAFRDTEPSPSSKPANFNLSGISIRAGISVRFGGRD